MTLTLLGLAAGMGSRFGGPKQLAPLGPNGETILDYSVCDARRAGFGAVVLVIRPELREAFEKGLVARWRDHLPVTLVDQPADAPANGGVPRTKPWGTGHAVLAAAGAIDGPFCVVNGDDYYGHDSYRRVAEFLAPVPDDAPRYGVVGFALGDTLSEAGGVNRAVLETDANGMLTRAEEVRGIEALPNGDGVVRGADGSTRAFARGTPVSMNMWAFTPAVLPQLAEGFRAFRDAHAADGKAEFLIPDLVEQLTRAGRATVQVLPGTGPWFGMTYPDDKPRVAAALADLQARGEYPSPVWA